MDQDADETADRETVVESYLKKLVLAGIEIDQRPYRNNDLQPTVAAGGDVQVSSDHSADFVAPDSVPCSPNKATAISRRRCKALHVLAAGKPLRRRSFRRSARRPKRREQ